MLQSAANRLTMRSGERYGYIDIVIVDNNIPEDEKQFFVTLLNPSGGAALGLGSTVTVIINPSDGAFGVFQFAQSSLGVQAVESGEAGQSVGYTTTPIQVLLHYKYYETRKQVLRVANQVQHKPACTVSEKD